MSLIVKQTECPVIFVNTLMWSKLKALLETGLKSVKTVVYWGPDRIMSKVSLEPALDTTASLHFILYTYPSRSC